MNINIGYSIDKPIVISRKDIDLNKISVKIETSDKKAPQYVSFSGFHSVLDSIFGHVDGDYFIIGENNLILNNKKYIVYYIEDKDRVKHSVFFLIEEN
jgi:hypothetical protein